MAKTNAVRLLEQAGTEFAIREYDYTDDALDAVSVATTLGVEPERVFKTLVTACDRGAHHVFCVPGNAELDLKKAARAAGARRIALIRLRELQPLTGYVHGGCSPIGMKRAFPTRIDETAELFETILVSAGVRGLQIEIAPGALVEILAAASPAGYSDLAAW